LFCMADDVAAFSILEPADLALLEAVHAAL
jgi:hypothetical protein